MQRNDVSPGVRIFFRGISVLYAITATMLRYTFYFWELVGSLAITAYSLSSFNYHWSGPGSRWLAIPFAVLIIVLFPTFIPAAQRGARRAGLGRMRRRFHQALLNSHANNGQYLRSSQIHEFRHGPVKDSYEFVLRAAPGHGDGSLEALYESVRSDLKVYSVATVSDMGQPGIVRGHILRFDPIADVIEDNPELYEPTLRDPAWPVPVGMSYDGQPATVQMYSPGQGGIHTSIAGRSGSGKNSLANAIIAGSALSGHELWLGDPKATELAWVPAIAVHRRETDPVGIVDMLEALQKEMQRRQKHLEAVGGRTTWSADDGPPILCVLDELTSITTQADGLDRKQVQRSQDLLLSLLSRARSTGIALLIMTQQLSTEALPSAARSQISRAVSASVSRMHDATMNVPGCDPDDPLFSPLSLQGRLTSDGHLTSAGLFVVGGSVSDPDRFRAALFDKERAAAAVIEARSLRSTEDSDLINTTVTDSPSW